MQGPGDASHITIYRRHQSQYGDNRIALWCPSSEYKLIFPITCHKVTWKILQYTSPQGMKDASQVYIEAPIHWIRPPVHQSKHCLLGLSGALHDFRPEVFHITDYLILLIEEGRNWTWDILHAKKVFYHWNIPLKKQRCPQERDSSPLVARMHQCT